MPEKQPIRKRENDLIFSNLIYSLLDEVLAVVDVVVATVVVGVVVATVVVDGVVV